MYKIQCQRYRPDSPEEKYSWFDDPATFKNYINKNEFVSVDEALAHMLEYPASYIPPKYSFRIVKTSD